MTEEPPNDGSANERCKAGRLEKFGLTLAGWSEQWFPDPLVFALLGIVVIFLLGLIVGESPSRLAVEGGKAIWI